MPVSPGAFVYPGAFVEHRLDPLLPPRVLLDQRVTQPHLRPQIEDVIGRNPRLRQPPGQQQLAMMAGVRAIAHRALLAPPPGRGLRRLGQMHDRAHGPQLLDQEPPAGRRLERHLSREQAAHRLRRRVERSLRVRAGRALGGPHAASASVDVRTERARHGHPCGPAAGEGGRGVSAQPRQISFILPLPGTGVRARCHSQRCDRLHTGSSNRLYWTVKFNCCVTAPELFFAVMVIGYVPALPALGVPLNVPVPLAAVKLTPLGRAPVFVIFGAG